MIRNLILAVLAVTVSAMLPTTGLSQTDGTSLTWRFPVGRKLEVEMTQRMKNSQKLSGREMVTATSNTNFMTWEVESFDEASGVATFKTAIDRIAMNMSSPHGKFEVDSASDEELQGIAKVYGEQLDIMVGKSFAQTMDTRGKLLAVNFPEEFKQAAMGKGSMEKLIKDASLTFPQGPIAVGHSWNQEKTAPLQDAGDVLYVSTYTYKGPEMVEGKKLDVVDIDIKMSFKPSEGSQNTIEITDQSTKGKLYFDAANGFTTSMKVEQSMTMDITFGGEKLNQIIENTTEGKFRLAK